MSVIKFRVLNHPNLTTFELEDVDLHQTIHEFKQKIAHRTGIPTDHQRLILRGKVLSDNSKTLEEYQLHTDRPNTIHLVVKTEQAPTTPTRPSPPQSPAQPATRVFQVVVNPTRDPPPSSSSEIDATIEFLSSLHQQLSTLNVLLRTAYLNALRTPQTTSSGLFQVLNDLAPELTHAGQIFLHSQLADHSYLSLPIPPRSASVTLPSPTPTPSTPSLSTQDEISVTRSYQQLQLQSIIESLDQLHTPMLPEMPTSAPRVLELYTTVFRSLESHLFRILQWLIIERRIHDPEQRSSYQTYVHQVAPFILQLGFLAANVTAEMLSSDATSQTSARATAPDASTPPPDASASTTAPSSNTSEVVQTLFQQIGNLMNAGHNADSHVSIQLQGAESIPQVLATALQAFQGDAASAPTSNEESRAMDDQVD